MDGTSSLRVPLDTERVNSMRFEPASGSLMVIALPSPEEKTRSVSWGVAWLPGTEFTGGWFTASSPSQLFCSCGSMALAVSIAPDTPEVTVTPRAGSGEMHVNLSTTEEAKPGMRAMTIQGIAPAAQTSAQVQVDVQTSQYELRTSQDAFDILVGETKELEVSTWRRRDDGLMEEEPDARIRPWLPTERDFFSWSPPPPYTKGNNELYGRVVMRITAMDARQDSELCFLDFTAIFPDKTEINKRVEITLKKAEYEVEFL